VAFSPIFSFKYRRRATVKGGATLLAFSRNGSVLASAGENDPDVHLTDVAADKPLPPIRGERVRSFCLAFTADSKAVGVADGAVVRLQEVATGNELLRFAGHGKTVQAVALSSDDTVLATADAGGEIRLWERATGKESRRFRLPQPVRGGIYALAFSPDGRRIACGGGSVDEAGPEHPVFVLDSRTGKATSTLPGHQGAIASAMFSPDGRLLVTGSEDGTALVWDMTARRGSTADAAPLTPERRDQVWKDLAHPSPAVAYRAVADLLAMPKDCLALFEQRLYPPAAPGKARVARLIADLASDDAATAQGANAELESLGKAAVPFLVRALGEASSAAQRQRLEQLIARAHSSTVLADSLRAVRAVEVLERMNTPAAKRKLEQLAAGDPSARLTREAKASLERLSQRPVSSSVR
jgi:hypothetical protein